MGQVMDYVLVESLKYHLDSIEQYLRTTAVRAPTGDYPVFDSVEQHFKSIRRILDLMKGASDG